MQQSLAKLLMQDNIKVNWLNVLQTPLLPFYFLMHVAPALDFKDLIKFQSLNKTQVCQMARLMNINKIEWIDVIQHQRFTIAELEDIYSKSLHPLFWDVASRYQNLDEDFIQNNVHRLNWSALSQFQTLSEQFIRDFRLRLDAQKVCKFQTLSENFMREFSCWIHWDSISIAQKLSEAFIADYREQVNWTSISAYQTLSDDFIEQFWHKINWIELSTSKSLHETTLRRFHHHLDWPFISSKQALSEQLLCQITQRYHDINWQYQLSKTQYSMDFLAKILPFVGISQMAIYQQLEPEFIAQFTVDMVRHDSAWLALIKHQTLNEDFIRQHLDKLDVSKLCKYQRLSIKFIDDHKQQIDWANLADQHIKTNQLVPEILETYFQELSPYLRLQPCTPINEAETGVKYDE